MTAACRWLVGSRKITAATTLLCFERFVGSTLLASLLYRLLYSVTMSVASNANESYCTFTLAPDVTAGGLPSEEEIAKDMESTDDTVRTVVAATRIMPPSLSHPQ